MNSNPQNDQHRFGGSIIRPFPTRGRRIWLWPQPTRSGLYGVRDAKRVVLTTNYLPDLVKLSEQPKDSTCLAIAIDTGGYSLTESIAFKAITEKSARCSLQQIPEPLDTADIYVKDGLAKLIGWKDDEVVEGHRVRLVNSEGDFFEITSAGSLHFLIIRILTGLRFFLGQALIFIPVWIILGGNILWVGTTMLFLSSLLLSLLWNLLPRFFILKGIIIGAILCVLSYMCMLRLPIATNVIWQLVAINLLISVWMSIILNGFKV